MQVAARTLGDVVRKLGEKVLPEIIPILEKGLESEESDQRQGVCIGLSEIMASTSKEHVCPSSKLYQIDGCHPLWFIFSDAVISESVFPLELRSKRTCILS